MNSFTTLRTHQYGYNFFPFYCIFNSVFQPCANASISLPIRPSPASLSYQTWFILPGDMDSFPVKLPLASFFLGSTPRQNYFTVLGEQLFILIFIIAAGRLGFPILYKFFRSRHYLLFHTSRYFLINCHPTLWQGIIRFKYQETFVKWMYGEDIIVKLDHIFQLLILYPENILMYLYVLGQYYYGLITSLILQTQ